MSVHVNHSRRGVARVWARELGPIIGVSRATDVTRQVNDFLDRVFYKPVEGWYLPPSRDGVEQGIYDILRNQGMNPQEAGEESQRLVNMLCSKARYILDHPERYTGVK